MKKKYIAIVILILGCIVFIGFYFSLQIMPIFFSLVAFIFMFLYLSEKNKGKKKKSYGATMVKCQDRRIKILPRLISILMQ